MVASRESRKRGVANWVRGGKRLLISGKCVGGRPSKHGERGKEGTGIMATGYWRLGNGEYSRDRQVLLVSMG